MHTGVCANVSLKVLMHRNSLHELVNEPCNKVL